MEPSKLLWTNVIMTTVSDKRKMSLKDLERKGEKLSLKNPLKQHGDFTPDQVENKNDPSCVMNFILFTCVDKCARPTKLDFLLGLTLSQK